MDYEKKYKEVLEWARKVIQGKVGFVLDEVLEKFPELKESEDERIRKALLEHCRKQAEMYNTLQTAKEYSEVQSWIAWLEKQGENTYNKELSELLHKVICKFINDPDIPYSDREKVSIKVLPYVELLEKQCEYESAYKVESKFHEGDWIVSNYNNVAYIESISETKYNLQCKDWYHEKMSIDYIDRNWHLWTIQDAKDGDVLFHSDTASSGIFIFKEILQCGTIQKVICYCDYDSEDGFCLGENHTCCWTHSKILHPATKEQCELLFEKIHNHCYEWDADKKELKKSN